MSENFVPQVRVGQRTAVAQPLRIDLGGGYEARLNTERFARYAEQAALYGQQVAPQAWSPSRNTFVPMTPLAAMGVAYGELLGNVWANHFSCCRYCCPQCRAVSTMAESAEGREAVEVAVTAAALRYRPWQGVNGVGIRWSRLASRTQRNVCTSAENHPEDAEPHREDPF